MFHERCFVTEAPSPGWLLDVPGLFHNGSLLPDLATYLVFIAAVLVVQSAPGPDAILVAARGTGQGIGIAFCTAVGMTLLAALVQLPLLALALGGIAQGFPALFDLIRLVGAGYLVWLGLAMIFTAGVALGDTIVPEPPSRRYAMVQGMVVNLMNPHPLIFMLALLPQFVDRGRGSVGLQLLALGAMQKALGFGVLALVALGAGRLGDWLAEKDGIALWQGRIAGCILIALGVWQLASR